MKKRKNHQTFFFCAFSDTSFLVKRISSAGDIDLKISCLQEQIHLHYDQKNWMLNEQLLIPETLQIRQRGNEAIVMCLYGPVETIGGAGRIYLQENRPVTVGKDYENTICYQFHHLVAGSHLVFDPQKEQCVVHPLGGRGVYRNGERISGSISLQKGDRLQLYGLLLLFLPPYLIYISYAGACRKVELGLEDKRNGLRSAAGGVRVLTYRTEMTEQVKQEEIEILPPPQLPDTHRQPLFQTIGPSFTMMLPLVMMGMLSSRMNQGTGYGYLTIVMGISSSLLGIFWGMTNEIFHRLEEKRDRHGRTQQYREYLKGLQEKLEHLEKEAQRIRCATYPTIEECLSGDGRVELCRNRHKADPDFFFTRLGIGDQPFPAELRISESSRQLVPDPLAEEALELKERFRLLHQVPIGIDLQKEREIAVVGSIPDCLACLLQIFWQQVIGHSEHEIRMICFYDKEVSWQKQLIQAMKWAPHVWSADGRMRLLAGNREEAGEVLPYVSKELEEKKTGPQLLFFLLDQELIRGETMEGYLWNHEKADRITVLGNAETMGDLKRPFQSVLSFENQQVKIVRYEREQIICQMFQRDVCEVEKLGMMSRNLALNTPDFQGMRGEIPEKVTFLELFDCSRVEELHSEFRWQESEPDQRLRVPVGKGQGGHLIYLDLHERFHGPHGLVAGTTGSGKSELLQTYLLSLAVQFSPQDVNFFMIDYKGGGTGNMVKELPHCAGVISNLSGNRIYRAMLAISSENKRRQKIFSESGVNHIDAYTHLFREGKVSVPLSHLIIVMDEFAELKKDQPEFMQEVISLAQVGRSLGVHLILATQKPSGTVDDKIWSNTRFRLCLRVQDRQDSMDMLHKPDAALLNAPGQCYMQIGNDEFYQRFQAAYCGTVYEPHGRRKEQVVLLSGTGRKSYLKRTDDRKMQKTEMELIIDYVNKLAQDKGYGKAEKLWMEALPETIALQERIFLEDRPEDGLAIGMMDDPENQRQEVLWYDPYASGHMAVCGGPVSGKTSLLQLLIGQIVERTAPKDAEFVLISMDQQGRNFYEEFPHCLGVLKEEKDVSIFFYQWRKLLQKRRTVLEGENYSDFKKKFPGELPFLYCLIDGFANLRKYLTAKQEQEMVSLGAEGIGLGVRLIMTANAVTDFPSRLFSKMKTTLALELSDHYQYGDVLRQYQGMILPESGIPGRGLCKREKKILEFQTFAPKQKEWKISKGSAIDEKIAFIPEEPMLEQMLARFRKEHHGKIQNDVLPIGYHQISGELVILEMQEIPGMLISGAKRTGKRNLIACICHLLNMQGYQLWMQGGTELLKPQELQKQMEKKKAVIVIPELMLFLKLLYEKGTPEEIVFWEELALHTIPNILILAAYSVKRSMEFAMTGFFQNLASHQWGIHLGGNLASQRVLEFEGISFSMMNELQPAGMGYLKKGIGGSGIPVQIPLYREGDRKQDDSGFICAGS